jgi:hypothetical protein
MISRHFPPLARRRAGEGSTCSGEGEGAESLANAYYDAVRISLPVVLAETQDGRAALSGAGVARPIACSLCMLGVDSAVSVGEGPADEAEARSQPSQQAKRACRNTHLYAFGYTLLARIIHETSSRKLGFRSESRTRPEQRSEAH